MKRFFLRVSRADAFLDPLDARPCRNGLGQPPLSGVFFCRAGREVGERPLALVVLKKEFAGKVQEEELLKFLMKFVQNRTIPKFGMSSQVVLVESIAKTSVGKINKRALREQFR